MKLSEREEDILKVETRLLNLSFFLKHAAELHVIVLIDRNSLITCRLHGSWLVITLHADSYQDAMPRPTGLPVRQFPAAIPRHTLDFKWNCFYNKRNRMQAKLVDKKCYPTLHIAQQITIIKLPPLSLVILVNIISTTPMTMTFLVIYVNTWLCAF